MHPLYFILGFPILVYGTGVWIYTLAQFPLAVVYATRGPLGYIKDLKYTCIVCFKKENSLKTFRFAVICQSIMLISLLPVLFSWMALIFIICSLVAGVLLELSSNRWLRRLAPICENPNQKNGIADDRVSSLLHAFQRKMISKESIEASKFDRTATRLSASFALMNVFSFVLVVYSIKTN